MGFDGRCLRTLLILLLALGCASCAAIRDRYALPTEHAIIAPRPASTSAPEDPVVGLLEYAHTLASDTPDQRVAAVRTARKQVDTTANGKRYARLAIALGTPAQRLYTPDEAARYAKLARNDKSAHWSLAARQYLKDYARIYSQLASDSGTDANALAADDHEARRVSRLKAQLRVAHRKLQALAGIEDRLDTGSP